MSKKKYAAFPLAMIMSLMYGLPAFARTANRIENVFINQMTSIDKTIENISDVICDNLDSITIEESEPVYDHTAESVYIPEYTYVETYVEQQEAYTTMSIDEFLALYGQNDQADDGETLSVDISEKETAYEEALANYNTALAEYESASQIIETTKEQEVEISEEVEDDQGNLITQTRTEIQTITETSYAGDVEVAQANLNVAEAALEQARISLEEAQSQFVVTEETVTEQAALSEEVIVIEDSEKTEETRLNATPQYCGDNVTWTLDDNGKLTISGTGEMYSYYGDPNHPWYNKYITSVVIESGVTSIGRETFKYQKYLTRVTIPDTVIYIDDNAFTGCTSLSSITIPYGVLAIGNNAFYLCSNLRSVTVPSSVYFIGSGAFSGTPFVNNYSGTFLILGDGILYKYKGSSSSPILPDYVTCIGSEAFTSCTNITSITIPNTVDYVQGGAFQGCTNLRTVSLPYGITEIEASLFWDCSNLTSVSIPNTVTWIQRGAFWGCNSLSDIYYGGTEQEWNDIYIDDSSVNLDDIVHCNALVTSVSLSDSIKTMSVGESFDLRATVNPSTAINKDIIWTSSNTSVATVSNGRVSALSMGTAIITATTVDGSHKASCSINVSSSVERVVLDIITATMNKGDYLQLTPTVYPTTATNKNVTWSSSNTSVATVSSTGLVSALQAGSAVITVKTVDGNYTAKCNVTVVIPVTGVSLNKTSATINKGSTLQLTKTVLPTDATNQSVTWTSSNTSVASVSSTGLVSAMQAGSAVITVKTVDGNYTAKCNVTVVVPVTGVSLNKTSATINKGSTLQLTKTVLPTDATNQSVIWTSSNTTVATVSSGGLVSALQAGSAVITVKTVDGNYTAKCNVTVVVPVTGVSLNKSSATINKGSTLQLTETVLPTDATNQSVTWTSSNITVATVSSTGLVSALQAGSAVITVKTVDGNYTAKCNVTVGVPVTGVSLNKTSATINKGSTMQLTKTVLPTDATNQSVTWTSSNTSVATVSSSGLVSALQAGSAVITVKTVDGNYTAKCNVTVVVPVTGVSLNKTSATINKGSTLQLTKTVLPTDATNQSVTWTSSNTSVATVSSSGLVSALQAGSAVITVKTVDGNWTAKCNVTVGVPVTGVRLNKSSATINKGNALQLTANVSPLNATNMNVKWSTSNSTVATVSNGLVTALNVGTAVITATTVDGGKTASCTINVVIPVKGITLNKEIETLIVGDVLQLTPSITPTNATNKNVTWTSSNTNVATVNSGLITAINVGTAVITAKTVDGGYKAFCTINVENTGLCGDDLTWKLDGYGKLTISGTGAMYDYSANDPAPWGTSIKSVEMNEGITSIGANAFSGCRNLTSIVFPEGITNIGYQALYNCSSLTKVTIPASVTGLGMEVFAGCTELNTAGSIGSGSNIEFGWTEAIPYNAFYGARSLTSITIPETVTKIGSRAFGYCTSLNTLTIPGSVKDQGTDIFTGCDQFKTAGPVGSGSDIEFGWTAAIPYNSFYGLASLTSVTIPDTVTRFGYSAFHNCTGLTKITIPSGVTAFGSNDLHGCSGLVTAGPIGSGCNIEYGWTVSIPSNAFRYCDYLTSITIPESITNIGTNAFKECTRLTDIYYMGSQAQWDAIKIQKDAIPSYVTIHVIEPVTSIVLSDTAEDLVVGDSYQLTATVLPENATNKNITWISSNTGVATVTNGLIRALKAGNAVITVKSEDGNITASCSINVYSAMGQCGDDLTWKLDGDGKLTISGTGAMYDYSANDPAPWGTSIKSVEMNEGITSIGANAFSGCRNLTSIVFPEGITNIGYQALYNCSSLTKVSIPVSVAGLGMQVFAGCTELKTAGSIGSGSNIEFGWTEAIPYNAFYGARSLTSITIPETVTKIGSRAFGYCTGLNTLTIPGSVKDQGTDIFTGCDQFTAAGPIGSGSDIEFGWTAAIPYNSFYGLASLTSVTIPDTVTRFGYSAFHNCTGLTKITIPSGVTAFGSNDLHGCSGLVTAGPIGSGCNIEYGWMESIPSNAFRYCDYLTSITIPESITSIGTNAFKECTSLADIYYIGSEADWNLITIKQDAIPSETVIHYLNPYNVLESRHTLSLDGNIGVNFYFEFSDSLLESEGAKVEFTVNGNTISQFISEGQVSGKYRRFVAEVTSVQMAADINVNVVKANGVSVYTEKYSVKEYCDAKLADSTTSTKLRNLIEALLNYGGYAQIQFNENTDNLANKDLINTDVSDVTVEMLEKYASHKGGSTAGITMNGTTLSLNSLTTIRHYFTIESGHSIDEYTFKLGSTTITPVQSGTMYYVEIPNISSRDLDSIYSVSVGNFYIQYGALSYAYSQLSKTNAKESLKNTCRALYKYNQAADAYFSS